MSHTCVHLATFGPHGTCRWLAEDPWETRHRAPTAADLCGRIASHYVEVQCDEHGTILTHLCVAHEAIASQDASWIRSRPTTRHLDRALLDEAGFLPHVDLRITGAAWDDCVAWTDEDTERVGVPQDEDGRLWDVIQMTRMAYRRGVWHDGQADVWLHRWPSAASTQPPAEDEDPEPPLVNLIARLECTTTRTIIVLDLPTGENR